MKPCTCTGLRDLEKRNRVQNQNLVDRFSSLPDALLIHILSLLPTKDVVATSVLSSRLRSVFPFITSLDFDLSSSSISLCVNRPYSIEKYPTFVSFVTNVLEAHQSEYLTRFCLKVCNANLRSRCFHRFGCFDSPRTFSYCNQHCLPDLNSLQLGAWISFPLTLSGLRELDLCILVKEPGSSDTQLPPSIFTCQTLEVLKLELNIGINQVLAMPSYSLPSLKLLYFSAPFPSVDDFLPRLLESSPLLEDLNYQPIIDHVHHLVVQSTSLRRLRLRMRRNSCHEFDNSDYVYIDTPNLERFTYFDNLAYHYSIQVNHGLVKAKLGIWEKFERGGLKLSFQQLINLIRSISYVPHLTLVCCILEVLNSVDVNILEDQLPVFPNMRHLVLSGWFSRFYWDKLLLPLLNSCPVLETLVFVEGVVCVLESDEPNERTELEQMFFRTLHPIPSCCRFHLKTLEIMDYYGKQRELEFIQFFLRNALVLENLIVHRLVDIPHIPAPDKVLVESTLRSFPKASMSCSIQVL